MVGFGETGLSSPVNRGSIGRGFNRVLIEESSVRVVLIFLSFLRLAGVGSGCGLWWAIDSCGRRIAAPTA